MELWEIVEQIEELALYLGEAVDTKNLTEDEAKALLDELKARANA